MDGVDHLASLLAIVKSDGWDTAFSEDVHYGGRLSDVENSTLRPYTDPLRSLRHSLEDAKLCMAALNNVKARLAKRIRNLQKRCTPLVLEDGIKRIPDEILALVFEAGHEMSELSEFALRVSYVSRRFRQVSLRTPLLWTRLSSHQPVAQSETFISRSGKLDLEVSLCNSSPSLPLLCQHSGRWARIMVFTNRQGLADELRLIHFPHLRYIHYDYGIEAKILQWDMPSFAHFSGYCSRFPPGIPLTYFSQLTCLTLIFKDHPFFDMTSLAQLLYQMSNLRDLSLEFQNCEDGDIDEDAMSVMETPKPHSFHIASLKIVLTCCIGPEFLVSLCKTIRYLTASVVDFSLTTCIAPDFLCLFLHGSTVRLKIGFPCSLVNVLMELLHQCETLRSVQFEMCSFEYDTWLSDDISWSYPSFCHLRFHDCVMFEEDQVDQLARSLFACESFQSLEIISCHKVSEGFLTELRDELGERLTWRL